MKRRDTVTVEGVNTGATEDESGVALIRAADSADTSGYIRPGHTYHVNYTLPGETLFEGPVPVSGGDYSTDLVVSTFAEQGRYARIRGYFYNESLDGSFSLEDIAIRDSVEVADASGPVVDIAFEGGATSILPGSEFTVMFVDDSGVNLVDREERNGIVLTFDGGADSTNITDEFAYELGSYRQGRISYALPSLPLGQHTISVAATDNIGNRTSEDLWVEVVSATDFQIRSVANHPNPFPDGKSEGTTILFQVPTNADVRIDVFTVGGRLIRTLGDIPATAGANEVYWDGRDQENDELANGVYLYRIQATSEEYRGDKAEVIGRAVIMR